jgi:hypothetical protein
MTSVRISIERISLRRSKMSLDNFGDNEFQKEVQQLIDEALEQRKLW